MIYPPCPLSYQHASLSLFLLLFLLILTNSLSYLQPENEPEITIELSSKVERPRTTLVLYNFTTGYFEEVVEDEPLLDLLTLNSTVTLKEDLDKALHRFGLQWSDSEGQVRLDQVRRKGGKRITK